MFPKRVGMPKRKASYSAKVRRSATGKSCLTALIFVRISSDKVSGTLKVGGRRDLIHTLVEMNIRDSLEYISISTPGYDARFHALCHYGSVSATFYK